MDIKEKNKLFTNILNGIEKSIINYLNIMYNTDVSIKLIPDTVYTESQIKNGVYKCEMQIKVNSNDEDIRNRVYDEACERIYAIRDYINNRDFDNLKFYLDNLNNNIKKLKDMN